MHHNQLKSLMIILLLWIQSSCQASDDANLQAPSVHVDSEIPVEVDYPYPPGLIHTYPQMKECKKIFVPKLMADYKAYLAKVEAVPLAGTNSLIVNPSNPAWSACMLRFTFKNLSSLINFMSERSKLGRRPYHFEFAFKGKRYWFGMSALLLKDASLPTEYVFKNREDEVTCGEAVRSYLDSVDTHSEPWSMVNAYPLTVGMSCGIGMAFTYLDTYVKYLDYRRIHKMPLTSEVIVINGKPHAVPHMMQIDGVIRPINGATISN